MSYLVVIFISVALTTINGQIGVGQPINLNLNTNFNLLQEQARQGTFDPLQMRNRDRRARDGWWNMYKFGEIASDIDLLRQPSLDRQIDLDFYFPFYGFRYNYSFIVPNGILAFSRPEWIQPPYTFPNPRWPRSRDPSFIAPFFADATYQYVGEIPISNVWYRTVHRSRFGGQERPFINRPQIPNPQDAGIFNPFDPNYETVPGRRVLPGYVEDDELLNNITEDIQNSIIGANGFKASNALVVTWERMAYGGSPKFLEVNMIDSVRQWQNTYQLVLATDEIRSYAMFNYGTINWTASNEAGALFGRGGKQAAIAGFNGGNGTGFTGLPYNGQGDIYMLARYSSGEVPGRWVYRVDEEIIRGGCSNESKGVLVTAPTQANMMGGITVNASGPCLRNTDRNIKIIFDEYQVKCTRIDLGRARCIMPMFHKIGFINTKISIDGGLSYTYFGTFYVVQPSRSLPDISLMDDVVNSHNAWNMPYADQLTMRWAPYNLTNVTSSSVRIDLMGYRENTEQSWFEPVGILVDRYENSGVYTFDPRQLSRDNTNLDRYSNTWKDFQFGVVRISIPDEPDRGMFYSRIVPFSWYFLSYWESEYGNDWALDLCLNWYDWDGKRQNFWMNLNPCPCILDQALLDMGQYMPVLECNMFGDSSCPYHRGAQHCVQGIQPTWTGAQQICCYNYQGFLMMSDDYEYNEDYVEFFTAGTPYRSHSYGALSYKIPPWIPTLSNFYNDLMPFHMCCKYSTNCEFLYWRRQSNACQDYKPPAAAFAYGDAHFITYDGIQYSFNGKGYYVLTMSDHPWNTLMVQVRLEQPAKTLWGTYPDATVITGVSVKENNSDVVQILARSEYRRWRYTMDVMVRGIPRFFDNPMLKWQRFNGLSVYSPARNLNQSEIIIQLDSGAAVRVSEAHGVLDVAVVLPSKFNQTYKHRDGRQYMNQDQNIDVSSENYYSTYGLLGTMNSDYRDDLSILSNTGQTRRFSTNSKNMQNDNSNQMLYEFGLGWKVGSHESIREQLFQEDIRPIYNPLLFARFNYTPSFTTNFVSYNASYLFSIEEVVDACVTNYACRYDYINTGNRQLALNTLNVEQKFKGLRDKGTVNLTSCGSLLKAKGAIKTPPFDNYLDGSKVTFICRPEYFLHGTQQRECHGGLWTAGWHVWCRDRSEEYALKVLTGIMTSLLLIGLLVVIFCCCYCTFVRPNRKKSARAYKSNPNLFVVHHENDTLNNQSRSGRNMVSAKEMPNVTGSVVDHEPYSNLNNQATAQRGSLGNGNKPFQVTSA